LPHAAAAGAFVVLVHVVWAPPAGIMAQGALLGGLTALVALGVALVYRANRIVNFAQGDLGALPGSFAVLLIVSSGASWVVAFATGAVAALVLGALVELLVARRFLRAPRLILTVATIGLAQMLAGAGLLLPRWFAVDTPPQTFPAPFDLSFTIDPIRFSGNDVVAMIVIPLAFIGIALFLRTRFGIAMRGCADDADRAAMLGIPVRRIHTLVWMLAALLAFLAVFLRAGIVGLPVGTVLGPAVLLRALAAAVIGRMERLPTIALAAIALGIVEQSVVWTWNRPQYVEPVIFVAVLGALLFTPAGAGLRGRIEPSTWRAVREPRPIPRQLVRLWEVRVTAFAVVGMVAVALIAVPAVLPESRTDLAAVAVIYGVIALSLVVLTGWAGQVSLGQMAFVGIGAAVGASITARGGWDLGVGLLGAAMVGAAVAVVIGLPLLRRRGLTIAVITLALSLTTATWLLDPQVFGSGAQFDWLPPSRVERPHLFGFIDVRSETRFYYLCLIALGLTVLMVRNLRRGRTGRVLIAIRENDVASSAYGIDPRRTTLTAFAVSGFLAAFAGALFVHHQNGLQLDSYSASESLVVFAMVVIGGMASVPGALLGALYVRGVVWFLPSDWQILATGAGMLVVLLVFRGGLGAAFADLRDAALRRIAARRALTVPSLASSAALVMPPRRREPSPPDSDALLRVRALDVDYDGVQVLFGVDLDVKSGEVVALLGTNGSGKSTLLRTVSGVLRPSHGQVSFAGEDITRLPPEAIVARGLVQAPGGHGVLPSLSMIDNLRMAGWPARDERAVAARLDQVLELFPELATRRHERAGNLSGGEQQMLTLAMATLAQPRVLLVDELSHALAPELIARVRQLLTDLRRRGTTILVVEQSVDLALGIADRAYFLEKGEVRFAGPAQELLDHPELLRAVFLGRAAGAPPPRATAAAAAPLPTATSLEITSVGKRYGGVVALDDVSFSVQPGEIVGVIGTNGAGKTTLFDVISGFVPADSGTVALRDDHGRLRPIDRLPAHRRARLGLGRSFQDGRLFPALTVRETIAVACERTTRAHDPISTALRLPMVTRSEVGVWARVDELVDTLGLDDFSEKFVHELSTGTRRVVDLACVLAHGPRVLLLDEPSSGIAQREAEALAPLLLRVRDTLGASLLVIEHDLALLGAIADRIVALHLGRVMAVGPPSAVLADPEVVRSYLGSDPPPRHPSA